MITPVLSYIGFCANVKIGRNDSERKEIYSKAASLPEDEGIEAICSLASLKRELEISTPDHVNIAISFDVLKNISKDNRVLDNDIILINACKIDDDNEFIGTIASAGVSKSLFNSYREAYNKLASMFYANVICFFDPKARKTKPAALQMLNGTKGNIDFDA